MKCGQQKGVSLMALINKYKKNRERPREIHPNNISILTVGGRALAKHCQRSTEKFWGVLEGKTESYKNELAFSIATQILKECVWLNIYIKAADEIIIECRIDKGYGIRAKIDGEFIGFLECYQPSSP